jgi:hypothetical protein
MAETSGDRPSRCHWLWIECREESGGEVVSCRPVCVHAAEPRWRRIDERECARCARWEPRHWRAARDDATV